MIRLQVQLTESQVRQLRRIAAEQGRSVSELVRRGVERELNAEQPDSRQSHLERLRERVRHLETGIDDLSEAHDQYLPGAYAHDDVR